MRVAVIGAGYVGSVTAACLARRGHEVVAVDTDPFKVQEIQAGRSPVLEPGLAELIAAEVAAGRLRATKPNSETLRWADLAVVCVSTPSATDGSVDVRAMRRVLGLMAEVAPQRQVALTILVRATIAPDKLRELYAELPETARHNLDLVTYITTDRRTTALHRRSLCETSPAPAQTSAPTTCLRCLVVVS